MACAERAIKHVGVEEDAGAGRRFRQLTADSQNQDFAGHVDW